MFRWNSTHEFPGQPGKAIRSDVIRSWIYDSVSRSGYLVEWKNPVDQTGDQLQQVLGRTRSTFILFTPRSLILGISPYVDVVSSIIVFGVGSTTLCC